METTTRTLRKRQRALVYEAIPEDMNLAELKKRAKKLGWKEAETSSALKKPKHTELIAFIKANDPSYQTRATKQLQLLATGKNGQANIFSRLGTNIILVISSMLYLNHTAYLSRTCIFLSQRLSTKLTGVPSLGLKAHQVLWSNKKMQATIFHKALARMPKLEKIIVTTECRNMDGIAFPDSLRTLDLSVKEWRLDQILQLLADKTTQLETLKLHCDGCNPPATLATIPVFHKLQNFTLSMARVIRCDDLPMLIQSMPQLSTIKLRFVSTRVSQLIAALKSLSNLTSLCLDYISSTTEILNSIDFSALTKLNILTFHPAYSIIVTWPVSPLTYLETSYYAVAFSPTHLLQTTPHLKELHLMGVSSAAHIGNHLNDYLTCVSVSQITKLVLEETFQDEIASMLLQLGVTHISLFPFLKYLTFRLRSYHNRHYKTIAKMTKRYNHELSLLKAARPNLEVDFE